MVKVVKAIARIILKIGLIIGFFALSMTGKFDNVSLLGTCRNVTTMLVLLSPVLYILLTGRAYDAGERSFKAFSIILTEIFAGGLVLLVKALCNAEDTPTGVIIVTCAFRLIYSIVLEIAATVWENKADSFYIRQIEWRTNQIAKVIFIYSIVANFFFVGAPGMHYPNAFGLAWNRLVFVFCYELILKFINWVTALPVTLRLKHYVNINTQAS